MTGEPCSKNQLFNHAVVSAVQHAQAICPLAIRITLISIRSLVEMPSGLPTEPLVRQCNEVIVGGSYGNIEICEVLVNNNNNILLLLFTNHLIIKVP